MTDLLDIVQPDEGLIAIVGLYAGDKTRGKAVQKFAKDKAEAQKIIAAFEARGMDVYFGVATYRDDESRKQANVHALKSVWLDVDCGPTKPYKTQAEGLAALKNFCETVGLPTPIIVNSGAGLHVYWPLTEAVQPPEWWVVAGALKARCFAEKFAVDTAVFDTARILRVPGTKNFKQDPPLPVRIMRDKSPPVPLEELAAILGADLSTADQTRPTAPRTGAATPAAPPTGLKGRGASTLGKAMAEAAKEYAPSDFDEVVQKCRQLEYCVDNRADLEEPLWRAALSIAQASTTPTAAIALVSEDHPDYSPGDAATKAAATLAPYTCEKFQSLNPGGCDGCPFLGLLKSPIRLGEVGFSVEPRAQPVPESERKNCPPGYVRKDDGVWKISRKPEEEDTHIYRYDISISARHIAAAGAGEFFYIKVTSPHDPVREERIDAADLHTAKLYEHLSRLGVFASRAELINIATYLRHFLAYLQRQGPAMVLQEQFGWHDTPDGPVFVLGDQEIRKGDPVYCAPSAGMRKLARAMEPKGSLSEWKRVMALYNGKDRALHAFAVASGFGTILLHLLGTPGAVINLVSPDSGTGKTSVLHVINSIYGHPKKLLMQAKDTYNARMTKVGLLNSIPATTDELSNSIAENLSQLLYESTAGVGKDRMEGSTNTLRDNNATWENIAVFSSNASFAGKLRQLKAFPDGELMRLIELFPKKFSGERSAEADALLGQTLMNNYGWAGPIFIQAVIKNYDASTKLFQRVLDELCTEVKAQSHERFWLTTAAANVAGAMIAKKLDLAGWDVAHLRAFAVTRFFEMRAERAAEIDAVGAVVGRFLNENHGAVLVINGAAPSGMRTIIPEQKLQRGIFARHEPDTKKLFISKSAFRDFCKNCAVDEVETIRGMQAVGALITTTGKKDLALHTTGASMPVPVLEFDYSHAMFQGVP